MLLQKVFDLFNLLRADNLSLFYQGVTDDDITDKLISLSDENIRSQTELERIRTRVSFAISECFQNIIRHRDVPVEREKQHNRPSMFMVRNIGRNYYIGSANLVKKEKGLQLKRQLRDLHKLSREELRQMYLKMLPESDFSEKGGAGLGLIEMARKSKQNFEFDFLSLSRYLSLFFMQLSFCEEEIVPEEKMKDRKGGPDLEQVRSMYNGLFEQNIMLLYKSDFSQDGMLPILDMMENNLRRVAASRLVQKKVMYVLVELFQNIIKHAATSAGRQEGVLLISAVEDGFELCTGNFIIKKDIPAFSRHLEKLNQLNQQGLQELYRKELTQVQQSTKGGAGLGLIETARYGNNGFVYSFLPVDDEISFFSLGIRI